MIISYQINYTILGKILIAANDQGLCFLACDDKEDVLIESFYQYFPKDDIIKQNTDILTYITEQIDSYFNKKIKNFDIPLDIKGTEFQKAIWQYLLTIPYGTTQTYQHIANILQRPSSVRAIANAIASNHIGIIIPCHRVIRTDGTLAGYRWGIERKKKLLALEMTS